MHAVLGSVYVLYVCILHRAGKEMELLILLLAMTAMNLSFLNDTIEGRSNPSFLCRLRYVLADQYARKRNKESGGKEAKVEPILRINI